MLRLTKNVALPTLRCFSSRITIDNINQKIRTADYAVRGEVVIRAMEIDKELKQGKKFPFDSLLYCNVGNPQAIKQKPITFLREVLCITSWPEVAEKHPEMFHPDAIQRAKELLIANPGGSGAYSNTAGVGKVCDDVAAYISKRDGFPCDPKNIFLTNGASQAIQDTLKLLIDKPTDCILIPIPQYPLYSASIHIFGGQYEPYYLKEEKDWALDPADIEKSIKSARAKGLTVKAIAAVNPGNPTGKCFTRENIEDICKICARENIAILADEVYQENIYRPGDKFVSFKKVMSELKLNCQLLEGVSCLSVDGALYTYFRLTMPPKAIAAAKKMGKAADAMYCMDLLNEAGVVCVPGSGFGQEEGTYHVRSTILPPENEIDQVVERMNNFHKKWMAKYN
ncbi:alanine aminotransferase 2 [Blastocystis sp. ATCC 50177/Nand II]|uniref:Alanine aminotransferase 2 n=1 Tax=Blastocystis sp. subtype 1 (strain ATCC 50177 / NandII) TaxID=478820 RepID=A0A196SDF0_BLAHN|nr:alanine aminotransferase 2 [Blastocystis sp. ATCC 50177/Nand II]